MPYSAKNLMGPATAAALILAGCSGTDTTANAENDAVTIANPDTDVAMTGEDDIAVYSSETLRSYLDGDTAPGKRFELDRVTFSSGSAQLGGDASAQVADVAAVMKDFPTAAITVTGFADPEGDADANRKLAADRALAVQQALQSNGIPDTAVRTEIGGEIGTSVTRNKRRVEFMVERR